MNILYISSYKIIITFVILASISAAFAEWTPLLHSRSISKPSGSLEKKPVTALGPLKEAPPIERVDPYKKEREKRARREKTDVLCGAILRVNLNEVNKCLMDKDIDTTINECCLTYDLTPLINAVEIVANEEAIKKDDSEVSDSEKIMERLLEVRGIKLNRKDEEGEVASHVGGGTGETALIVAAKENSYKTLDRLIKVGKKKGLDIGINLKDILGRTALIYAAWEGNMSSIRLLLTEGANPLIGDNNDKKPFDRAKKEEIKKLLLDAEKIWSEHQDEKIRAREIMKLLSDAEEIDLKPLAEENLIVSPQKVKRPSLGSPKVLHTEKNKHDYPDEESAPLLDEEGLAVQPPLKRQKTPVAA